MYVTGRKARGRGVTACLALIYLVANSLLPRGRGRAVSASCVCRSRGLGDATLGEGDQWVGGGGERAVG